MVSSAKRIPPTLSTGPWPQFAGGVAPRRSVRLVVPEIENKSDRDVGRLGIGTLGFIPSLQSNIRQANVRQNNARPVRNRNGAKRQKGVGGIAIPTNSALNQVLNNVIQTQKIGNSNIRSFKPRLAQFVERIHEMASGAPLNYIKALTVFRSLRVLDSKEEMHANKNITIVATFYQLCDFFVLLYLDSMHDFLRTADSNRTIYKNNYSLQRFMSLMFPVELGGKTSPGIKSTEYIKTYERLFFGNNPGSGVTGNFTEWKKILQGLQSGSGSEYSWKGAVGNPECPFLTLLVKSGILIYDSKGHLILGTLGYESKVLKNIIEMYTNHNGGRYRVRTFPINELPKRKTSKVVVDMSTTGAVRFFAQKARQVVGIPNMADQGVTFLQDVDIAAQYKQRAVHGRMTKKRSLHENSNSNNGMSSRENNLYNRNIASNLINRTRNSNRVNSREITNVANSILQRIKKTKGYANTFTYYKLLELLNKNIRKNYQLDETSWGQLKTHIGKRIGNNFNSNISILADKRRTKVLDLGALSVDIKLKVNSATFTVFYMKMDLGSDENGHDNLEKVVICKNESKDFITNVASAKEMFNSLTVPKYVNLNGINVDNKNFNTQNLPLRSILSKFLGDFSLYFSSLVTNWKNKRGVSPTVFASGDKMSVVGYIIFRELLKTGELSKGKVVMKVQPSGAPQPFTQELLLNRDSVVFEDASVYGIHEISERSRRN
jgi:hypothetical protein